MGLYTSLKAGYPKKPTLSIEDDIQNLMERMQGLPPIPPAKAGTPEFPASPATVEEDITGLQARMRDLPPVSDTPDYRQDAGARSTPNIADLLSKAPSYDMMGNRQGYEAPVSPVPDLLKNPPSYDMMGKREGSEVPADSGLQPSAEITDQGEPDAEEGLSPENRAALLNIMSGLIEGGRRMNAVRRLTDIQKGLPPPTYAPETQLSGEADKILKQVAMKKQEAEAKAKELEAGKSSSKVQVARQQAKAMGLDPEKIQTDAQADSFFEATGMQEKIKGMQAQRGATEAKTTAAEGAKLAKIENAKRLEAGEISAMSDDAKKALTDAQKQLMGDEIYKLNIKVVDTTSRLRDLVNSNNTVAIKGIPVALARAMGEVGNLSQTEQDVYRQDLGMSGEIRSWKEWWNSVPDSQRVDKIRQLVKTIENNAVPKVVDAVNRYAGAYSSLYREVPPERIKEHFLSFGTTNAVKEGMMSEEDRLVQQARSKNKRIKFIGSDGKPYTQPVDIFEKVKAEGDVSEVIGLE
jgi:hypothetical protein